MAVDYVLKVSKEGFDVRTAAPKDLIFDSTKNQMKVAVVLSEEFTSNGSNQLRTLAHDLGYIPGYLAFVKIGSRWYGNLGEDPIQGFLWQFYADDTNIYLDLGDPGASAQTIKIKVYVLVDGATDTIIDTEVDDDWGIKVSRPGESVLTAPAHKLNISTKFVEMLQIREVKTIQNTGGDVEEAHGLGYRPAWVAVAKDNAGVLYGSSIAFLVPYLLVGNLELMVWSDLTNIGTRGEAIVGIDFTFKVVVLNNRLE